MRGRIPCRWPAARKAGHASGSGSHATPSTSFVVRGLPINQSIIDTTAVYSARVAVAGLLVDRTVTSAMTKAYQDRLSYQTTMVGQMTPPSQP